jgi:hypothetical protein
LLSRDEIEDRWIGCCSDPEYFRAELEALGTAKRLATWMHTLLRICDGTRDELGCAGCLQKTYCPRIDAYAWLRGTPDSTRIARPDKHASNS